MSTYPPDDSEFPSFAFEDSETPPAQAARRRAAPPPPSARFLGMTARQRFVISLMLLLAVIAVGSMCLLVTGRIGF